MKAKTEPENALEKYVEEVTSQKNVWIFIGECEFCSRHLRNFINLNFSLSLPLKFCLFLPFYYWLF